MYAPKLDPFPEGWYFVASRRDVLKTKLLQRTWMGENIIVWSDSSGRISVAEAYCPHLGADLGPSAGGRVCRGRLVCPFHGYEFDTTGQCVATPYAKPPKAAKLRTFATYEILDMVFAWWGINGRKPQWNLPSTIFDQSKWSGLKMKTLRFAGHPQETTENSVDLAHLRYVHGYGNVDRIDPISVDGPRLTSNFVFKRTRKIARLGKISLDIAARTLVVGLGYSYVNIRERSVGMDTRMWVLATPVDGTLIDMTVVSQVREIKEPKRDIVGLKFLPVQLRAPVMNGFISRFQRHDVLQDVVIWGKKRYTPRPRLCRSDGEIMPYRIYCTQFYPDPTDAESASTATTDR